MVPGTEHDLPAEQLDGDRGPTRPAKSANRARATASGRMARSISASWSARLATNSCPPTAGYRRARAFAVRVNVETVVPGRRRMSMPSAP